MFNVSYRRQLYAAWREHRLLLALVGCYSAGVAGLLSHAGIHTLERIHWHRPTLLIVVTIWGVASATVAFANRRQLSTAVSLQHVIGAYLAATFTAAFISVFSAWKQALARLVPYDWDPTLHAISIWLHGGRPEWEYFEWLLHSPKALIILDRFYLGGWVIFTTATFVLMAWSANRRLRLQFFLATLLTWICLGSIGAALFASGGPAFYAVFVPGPDPYWALRSELAHHPSLFAVELQRYLLNAYVTTDPVAFGGISAMPSLHVAQALLSALGLHAASRSLASAVAGTLYVATILFGSVVLGWHYAVDGYVSIAATACIWMLSKQIARSELS